MRLWNFQINQELEAVVEEIYQRVEELKTKER
jgi:very-short-patch-repair endonuclease